MLNRSFWSKNDIEKLKDIWEKSGQDRDKFKVFVLMDTSFETKRSWSAYYNKIRELGLYQGSKPSKRYAFTQLEPVRFERLKAVLQDDTVSWGDVFKEFREFTRKQLRNFALNQNIKLHKYKTARPPKNANFKASALPKGLLKKSSKSEITEKEEETVNNIDKNSDNELTLTQQEAMLREGSIAAKRFEMLFGDLKKIPEVDIPRSNGGSPIIIKVKDENNPKVTIINSPLVGTLAAKKESMDIFRNALRLAQADNSDAVIITGNLIYCLVEKYGKQRPYRTQVIGLEPDPELLESSYPKTVLDEIGPLYKRIKEGKLVFMTIKVYLDHVFKLIRQKFLDSNGQPILKCNIYVSLGEIEESIAMFYANESLRVEVFQEKAFAHQKIRELRSGLSKDKAELKYMRLHTEDESGENDEDVEVFEPKDIQEKEKEVNSLIEQINDWQIYDRLLVLMGNAATKQVDALGKLMINYLAYRIELDIPNAKVIGVGDTYLKIGKQLAAIVSDKTIDSVRGGLAGRLREKLYNFVKANPGDRVPAVILGAGLNPWGTGLYGSYRIREQRSTLDDLRMTEIDQLLPCIDSQLYRETVQRMLKAKERLAKLASTPNFQSGVMQLSFFEPAPVPVIEWYTSAFLTNQAIFGSEQGLTNYVSGTEPRSKRLYLYKEGCTHYGAAFVARYESLDDPNGRYIKHHNQVLFEAFMKHNVPIHMYFIDGDIQHWLNYQTYKEVNKQLLDPEDMLVEMTRIEKNADMTSTGKIKALKILAMTNTLVAGVLQPEEQIELYGKAMAPYADFFIGVIERAKKAGITMTGKPGDLGIINIGQGNHNENSWKYSDIKFSEAKITRKELINILLRAGYNPLELERDVIACETGGVGIAEGTFIVGTLGKDAYEYCVFMKHKHGSSKTQDNMRTMIKNFSTRGTTGNYGVGRFTVNLGGDDHMGGHAVTRNAFHMKTGGQMFDGPFGHKLDFPKQNLFSAVASIPSGGPSWGPFTVIRFDFRITRKLAAYKIMLPEKLFPNPA
ncbi:MAG: hypothetical protein HYW77_01390 [Parcubacteria group bacterium]|nr:hypothetical protein [Parcubacteria group bacterium]